MRPNILELDMVSAVIGSCGRTGHSWPAPSRRSTRATCLPSFVSTAWRVRRATCSTSFMTSWCDVRVAHRALGQYQLTASGRDADDVVGVCAARPRVHSRQDQRGQGARHCGGPQVRAETEAKSGADRACAGSAARGRALREIGALVGCHASTVSRALENQQEEEEIA